MKINKFWLGFSISAIISIGMAGFVAYQNSVQQNEIEKNKKNREKTIRDSIAKVNVEKQKYFIMVKAIERQDSIYLSLKYKIGDIVYLKPDSTKGVIENIVSDDKMDCFIYYVLYRNKNGELESIQKRIPLIY